MLGLRAGMRCLGIVPQLMPLFTSSIVIDTVGLAANDKLFRCMLSE